MKLLKQLTVGVLTLGILAAPWSAFAADKVETKDAKKTEKPKPYLLKTCAVSDEKLGEMGKPFVFTHEGREIQLCCKDCLTDFKKDTAKYIKKVELAEQKLDKKSDKKADKKDKK
jgi:hypothetical protein